MEHSHDNPLTPDEEAALAQTLLAKGELTHGAFHLAGALVTDPDSPDWLGLLDRYVAAAPEPLELAPLKTGEEGNYFGTVALRAAILARIGRVTEGVELLLQVIEVKPEVPFLGWAIEWLRREPGAGSRVDRKALLRFFGFILQRYPGTVIADEAAREDLRRLAEFSALTIGDPDPEPMLTYGRAAIARKLGQFDEAQGLAERGYRARPGYHLASALVEVHKARGDEAAWRDWLNAALRHDPANVPARLDAGDQYLDRGDYAEAARWYEAAVEQQPDHPWATPSLYAARYLQGGDGAGAWLARLRDYAAAHPDNERATSLARQGIPFVGYLPGPQEATLGILRQIVELAKRPEGPPKGEAKVTLSALEAPSARLACALGIAALGTDLRIPFTITSVQKPDPRLPRAPVRYQVWKYREERKLLTKRLTTDPVPAVHEPPAPVAAAVAAIGDSPYDRPRWLAAGADLVARLKPQVDDLLGCMAHPPELPQGAPAPLWVQRVQVAAALALAAFDETPWPRSVRRQVLFDLANGPMDWTVDAAVIALTTLAEGEPSIAGEVMELFLDLLRNQPRPGYVCYERVVVHCCQQLPGLSDELRSGLADYQKKMESHD